MEKAGDIYLGNYEGYYCVSCERFYTEKDLDDGKKCPTHKKETQYQNQETYLFRMSKYGDKAPRAHREEPRFHPTGELQERGRLVRQERPSRPLDQPDDV